MRRAGAILVGLAALVAGSAGAALPPTIDLAFTNADVTIEGTDSLGSYPFAAGQLVSEGPLTTGDFNGDGIDDVLVGSPLADGPGDGRSGGGEAYVILGSPGISGSVDIASSQQDLTVLGAEGGVAFAGDNLGASVASGDVNGDSYDDVIVGAPEADGPGNARPAGGEAYVIFGSASAGGTVDVALGQQGVTILGAEEGDRLGIAVASGDFDGDGIDDVLVGAPAADRLDNGTPGAGETYVIPGSPDLSGTWDIALEPQTSTIFGSSGFTSFSGSPLAAGDVNGDDIDDIIVAAPIIPAGEIGAVVVFGSDALAGSYDIGLGQYDLGIRNVKPTALATGDLSGDGIDEIIIAAQSAGAAYVINGSPVLSGVRDVAMGEQDSTIEGGSSGSAAASGDFDGDQADDLVIGAAYASAPPLCPLPFCEPRWSAGAVYGVYGSPILPVSVDIALEEQDLTIFGAFGYMDCDPMSGICIITGDSLGTAVAAGDINDDGRDDFLAGAPAAGDGGMVYVIFGDCVDSDGDGLCNGDDNCPDVATKWTVPPGDADCDGFTDAEEAFVATDAADDCPDDVDDDAWPADMASAEGYGKHDGTVNILDIVRVTPPVFGASPPDLNYVERKDFNGDGVINILDIVRLSPPVFGEICS
jgi:hypothetical protein